MYAENNQNAFLTLVKAGLWESNAQLLPTGDVDYAAVMSLAEEQSVVGLVTVGLEHVVDVRVPKEVLLQFIGQSLELEQRNLGMNGFIAGMVEKMRTAGIYLLLLKGQGIAQCYEKPLWRACGDVDFLLSDDYNRAKSFLIPLADNVKSDSGKHLGMDIESWVVELHGNLHCGLSSKINRVIDDVQRDIFKRGDVRSWQDGNTQVFLPGIDSDVFFVFTHFLNHFYKGGLGLRQICDWCRLLWTYRDSIRRDLLHSRLKKAGLMTEWKAFGAFAVEYLRMPIDSMPFYENHYRWTNKAEKIKCFIIRVGNFGHNRAAPYREDQPRLVRKTLSYCRRIGDLLNHAAIFPLHSLRFFIGITVYGLKAYFHGE